MSKKGQVTLFIIMAVVIVAVVLIFLFYPKIQDIVLGEFAPQSYFKDCVEEDLQEPVTRILSQGGSANPENYYTYREDSGNKNIEYLCYTVEEYQTCVMQQPMLLQHIESEIANEIESSVEQCSQDLEQQLENKGYSVSAGSPELVVDIQPENIVLEIDYDLTATKEVSQAYETFKFEYPSEIYGLIMISTSILNYEARYGDSETTIYMTYYPELKVEKYKQSDSTTIYILTNRDTEEKFYFASRSLIWPAGY